MSAVSANALIKLTEIIDNFLQGFVERNLGSCKVWRQLALLIGGGVHHGHSCCVVQSIGGAFYGFGLSVGPGLAGIAAPGGPGDAAG